VEPEGGKRLQNIKQRREKIQSSDFWIPALDPDASGEQAVPHSEGSWPVAEYPPAEYEAGRIVAVRALDDLQWLQLNPIFPFQSVPEYKLTRFFPESKWSLINIDRFCKANVLLNTHGIHFRSGYTWRNTMRGMIDQLGCIKGTVDFQLHQGCAFYCRDLEDTIQYMLRQSAHNEHLVFELIHEFDDEGNRVYTDMHTGDCWWTTQV